MNRTFIIAEVGVNHNADLGMANKLIEEAVSAGADAIKFQTAIPELVATGYAQKAEYQKQTSGSDQSQLEMIRKIHFPLVVYSDLKKTCEDKGIIFFSSAFDMKSLNFLKELGQSYYKIPSGEITNLCYLRQIGNSGKPIFLSTGMATLGEIEAAIEVLENAGMPRAKLTVLHCTTEYPTPMIEVNLRAMQSIHEAFGVAVGYSDHTQGIEVAIAAVTMGATVIEKHFTLDRNLPGPDHQASLEPSEFKAMVLAIRNIEKAMGDGIKRPSPSEEKNKPIARKSLIAATAIIAGECFTEVNLAVKRPGTGISPMRWDEFIGQVAQKDYQKDELI
ncbi:MAG: N-acetylneuraminate synthase [Nitrospina sp.]|nr:N-acetylneuraminate synthase [Nitrospina sp.]